jgi:hypothetical protein
MASRTIWTSLALAVLTAGAPMTASAQGGRGGGPPYTPAAGAKDLRAVIFNWTSHMGMLRGVDEHELIVTLEYQGTGTLQVDGQPCTIKKYRVSTNYQLPGQRTQITCARGAQTYTNVEVVNGQYAWNESVPGAEIGGTKGTVTPMAAAVQERLIRLWASPQGAPKAAILGVNEMAEWGANPAVGMQDGVTTAGKTSLTWEGTKPVLTFPIPGVPGATATATLDAKYMAERVVVKHAGGTTEFAYSGYKDWNNKLNLIDTMYAGRLTERRNNAVVRDLTTVETETGSVYVVMPVPASVKKAITPTVPAPPERPMPSQAAGPGPPAPGQAQAAAAPVTPRRPDGKPDLTGAWNSGGMNWRYGNRRCGPTQAEGCTPAVNQTADFEFEAPSRFGPNRPLYKPQHWDKVIALDMWTNKEDPVMTCQPLGIPRQGPPRRIIQTDNEVIFFYGQYADGGGGNNEYRDIPTTGGKHNPQQAVESRYHGYTIGRWEGDTLVLDSISFVDTTWLARGGFFHSSDMHVIEKLTRKGNEILYEVTVEDPEVLVEPWVMTPKVLRYGGPGQIQPERNHCEVYELDDIATQIRH